MKDGRILVVEEQVADAKEGPYGEPKPVCLALGATKEESWCEPYVVSNRWVRSRTRAYFPACSECIVP